MSFGEDFDQAVSGTPLDFLTGASGRRAGRAKRAAAKAAKKEREEQERIRLANMAEWEGLTGAARDTYAAQGGALWNIPEEEFIAGPERSELAGAGADPRAIEAQMRALGALGDVYQQGGLTTLDRARIAEAQAGERTAERGQREALQAEAEQRGMGAGGSGYANALMAQQQGANRLNQQGLGIEGMAQERALSAMQAAGSLGGQARGQSFDEDATRRQAQDLLARYNTDYARGRSTRAQQSGERRQYGLSDLAGDYYGNLEGIVAGKTGQHDRQREDSQSREQTARDQAVAAQAAQDEQAEWYTNQGRAIAGAV